MNRRLLIGVMALLVVSVSIVGARVYVRHRAAVSVPGPSVNGKSVTLPNGWRVSPAGRQIDLPGDLVFKILLTPDGKSLVVNTGGYHDHSVNLIDLKTEKLKSSVNVWKDWAGMTMDPASGAIFVSGGGPVTMEFLHGTK